MPPIRHRARDLFLPTVVDEWQWAPDVLDAIRRVVDEDASDGTLLLAGSTPTRSTHCGAGRFMTVRGCGPRTRRVNRDDDRGVVGRTALRTHCSADVPAPRDGATSAAVTPPTSSPPGGSPACAISRGGLAPSRSSAPVQARSSAPAQAGSAAPVQAGSVLDPYDVDGDILAEQLVHDPVGCRGAPRRTRPARVRVACPPGAACHEADRCRLPRPRERQRRAARARVRCGRPLNVAARAP